jgi:hypothetical protein
VKVIPILAALLMVVGFSACGTAAANGGESSQQSLSGGWRGHITLMPARPHLSEAYLFLVESEGGSLSGSMETCPEGYLPFGVRGDTDGSNITLKGHSPSAQYDRPFTISLRGSVLSGVMTLAGATNFGDSGTPEMKVILQRGTESDYQTACNAVPSR